MYESTTNKAYLYSHKKNLKIKIKTKTREITFKTNKEGIRAEKSLNAYQKCAIFLGDSIIEGAESEMWETIPAILSQKIKLPVLNFGVGGFNTVDEYFFLKDKLNKNLDIKAIFLGFCLNDVNTNQIRKSFDSESGNWRFYDYINNDGTVNPLNQNKKNNKKQGENKTILCRILKKDYYLTLEMWNAFKKKREANKFKDPQFFPNALKLTEIYLKKIKQEAESRNAKLIVVIFPYEQQLSKNYQNDSRMQDPIIKICNSLRINYIDLFYFLKDAYLMQKQALYSDDTHPNTFGNTIIGEFIGDEVLRRNLLK